MGGRGAYSKQEKGIPISKREYSSIGKLGKIKIIQCDTKSNYPTPTYSNTKNTTYFAYSKERDKIEKIFYYRNHKLVKCVEFKEGEKPHTHKYDNDGNIIKRNRHDSSNVFELNERDKRLMKEALEWNKNHKKD